LYLVQKLKNMWKYILPIPKEAKLCFQPINLKFNKTPLDMKLGNWDS